MNFDDKTFVLGIGSQKAGTTWLHNYLSQRGDIYMPARKEMHYFDAKYRPDMVGARRRGRLSEWTAPDSAADGSPLPDDHVYREFFRQRVPEEMNLFGEITPTYALIGELGYSKIRELFRKLRIIFIMRDPVERFYSQVRMFNNKPSAKSKPNRDAEDLMDKRRFLELSTYEKTIRALDSVFAKDEVIYLFYETLFRQETIEALCAFLGVDYRPADFELVVNVGAAPEPVPPEIHENLLARFEQTYAYCRDRFGADVPAQWHTA